MAKKYIIIEKTIPEIRFGYVQFHKDLLNENESTKIIKGGGLWEVFIYGNKEIILFGDSVDFGKPNKEDIETAINNMTKHSWWQLSYLCKRLFDSEIKANLIESSFFDDMKQTFKFNIK